MELLPVTLAANETRQFAKAGRYFEIIDSTYAVTIQFTGPNGNISDSMVGALSGLFLEDPFTHFSLTNGATAQTVTLLIMETGRGGSRRQPGIVSVVNKIGTAVAVAAGSPTIAIGNTADPVLLIANNPRGYIFRRGSVTTTQQAGGTSVVRLIAAPTAPASAVPANSYQMVAAVAVGAQTTSVGKEDLNLLIPAGWGIWTFSQISGANAVSAFWELTGEAL